MARGPLTAALPLPVAARTAPAGSAGPPFIAIRDLTHGRRAHLHPASEADCSRDPAAAIRSRSTSLEEAAQTALDAADRIIAVLDRLDGDADHEDNGDAEPSLAAPENNEGSQVVYMRGSDRDGEAVAPETVLSEVSAEPVVETEILPWRGRGNVIAATGVLLLDLAKRR
jgi:hypothetical protein